MMSLDELDARTERRARLVTLTAVCACALALLGLARVGPSDAGASRPSFAQHCHSSPEDMEWCEWVIWMEEDAANRAYFEWATRYDGWTVWDDLAQCESGGNWHINTGNGYYGGLQFALESWQSVGGSGYPHEHSRETQIVMGERLQARQGWGAWPACSRELGLR